MADSQLLEILLIAAVAGVVLFRLYSVLGRRTGGERPPQESRLPDREPDQVVAASEKVKPLASRLPERSADPVLNGLIDISLADKSFDKDRFLTGARAAYEMIETAFATGDRAALKPLLSEEVFAAFDAAIKARETQGRHCVFTFVGFKDAKIVGAALRNRTAEVTLSFEAEFISATLDANGNTVEGDGKSVRDVTDIWTFCRDVRARDPNWTLTATAGQSQ
jgi:predicted lipid-binding transport protein (Tim44 family)